ncbi:D-glycero-beta-D-manno-heptose-7-phosphate kinase [Mucilaginibacter pocheonensis]|uniref:D-beta-D-heptose 7-phosphate kinase/D-beta-D-heptose 1-phosphate adenosyltransferase n=1 Tax=Mucilaginibacter pocheonensis TaxID=398050 RepID=A0ABU1TGA1_9SPHI|nr:D-glycero-beta-D-manno-heptose-7-phosphate kinase [Mucilaginibacter pocheonensis]MDR6944284.1 D-beta-D-heptose 7-phosphate kinase/D-beta-D-heptose 1-phosphate adenosyltransferase [Mucilaginibacter pocheonensis]
MNTDTLNYIQLSTKKPTILVIGDLMVDHYIWGNATRLSPEAPVPVVNVNSESVTLGGAGNVVQNLISLGAQVTVGGVIGNDATGNQLMRLLTDEGTEIDAVIKENSRTTTVKTRVLVGNHQLVRLDREITDALPSDIENELIDKVTAYIDTADLVVLSDYNKGLFSPQLTQQIITTAVRMGKRVIIDPKGTNFEKYKGAYIIKPNRKELAEAVKLDQINSMESLKHAADIILEQTGAEYLVVTLSEQGMVILGKHNQVALPVKATEVFDVTGAGDTVLSTMAYFLAMGLSLEDACELANHAAAIVIRHLGSATTTVAEIIKDIAESEEQRLKASV